jgi:hypothetical protein
MIGFLEMGLKGIPGNDFNFEILRRSRNVFSWPPPAWNIFPNSFAWQANRVLPGLMARNARATPAALAVG